MIHFNHIYTGDCRHLLERIESDTVDAVVTDPPYGLGYMNREWDAETPGVEVWTELLRVAKPGAYLAAFGGSRTMHRTISAIADARWEIRDTLLWLYGTGFPKGGKIGVHLKPCYEPIVLARKPPGMSVAACHEEYGTGVLQINACRDEAGRWPGNVLLDEVAASELDREAGAVSRFFYTPKASREEREAGLDDFPAQIVNDGRETSMDTPFQRGDTLRKNTHPTVKPIALMRWLVRLVSPKGGCVLDPFAGSGTTGVAAVLEGRTFVGAELGVRDCAIAQARLDHWINARGGG